MGSTGSDLETTKHDSWQSPQVVIPNTSNPEILDKKSIWRERERTRNCLCICVWTLSQGTTAKCCVWSCLWSSAGDSWRQKSKHVIIAWSPPKPVHQSKGQHGWCICPIRWFLVPQLLFSLPIQLSPCINTSKIFLTNTILIVFQPKATWTGAKSGEVYLGLTQGCRCQQEKEL